MPLLPDRNVFHQLLENEWFLINKDSFLLEKPKEEQWSLLPWQHCLKWSVKVSSMLKTVAVSISHWICTTFIVLACTHLSSVTMCQIIHEKYLSWLKCTWYFSCIFSWLLKVVRFMAQKNKYSITICGYQHNKYCFSSNAFLNWA